MKRSVLIALAAVALAALSLGVLSVPAGASLFNTTTSLSVAPSSVTYGQETTAVFTATVTAQGASNPGSGTVTVTAGSTTLCSFDLTTPDLGTGSCSPSSDTLLPASGSPYSVTASYGGSGNGVYSASPDSTPVSLTVNRQDTATSLSFTGSPVVYGQESTLTFDSSVTPTISGTPTGTIAVAAGATPLCTITLPDPSCSTNDDPLSATGGPYAITATYSGDTNYAGSVSSPQDLAVTKASTTNVLDLSSSSVTFGDESTLLVTATVSPEFAGSPSGTITVTAGGNPLCNIVLPATTCSPSENAVPASGSPYAVSASYPGDANFTGSLSNLKSLTVSPSNTTTTLSIAPTTVAYGNESTVAFTATLSSSQSGTPTGTITVTAGPTTLCTIDVASATSCNTTDTTLAASGSPYSVVASYGGDGNFTPSSDTKSLTVTKASTTTTLVGPFSVVYGNEGSVTFSPTVTPAFSGSPAGLVTVAAGATTLCTFTLPAGTGCAAPGTLLPPSGSPYSVTATYAGDSNFTTSTSSPAQSLTVAKATTTTTLTISSSTVTYGNEASLTFTASVAPEFAGTPGGTVTVKQGPTALCSITLPATTCHTADDPLDASGSSYAIAATYGGDANFTGSTSTTKNLTVAQASTSTSLSLSQSSVSFGSESAVVFTATVTPQFPGSQPTGVVTVATPSATLCTITLPATTCSTTDQALPPSGTPYSVTAGYPGDTNFTSSTSTAHNLSVTAASTTTSLSLSSPSVVFGNEQTITFTATVTPTGSGGPQPTGVITVATPSTTLCTIAVGSATTCTTGATALGASGSAYAVVATYGGDANYGGSFSSPPKDLTVNQASTSTALTLSSSTVVYGNEQSITFTAAVAPQFSGSVPTGIVTVSAGATTLCTISLPLNSSCSTVTGTPLGVPGSPYALTATYGGDANFTGSADTSKSLTVNQATTTTTLSLSSDTVAFGSEHSVTFTATVTPQFAGSSPSGVVTVATDAATLCTITLPATTCHTADDPLAPSGTAYSVSASYPGDTNFIGATSTASSLTITGGTSTTVLSPPSSSAFYGNETSLIFTVTVTPVVGGGATPVGTAAVAVGTTTLCTATLDDNGIGTCSPTNPFLLPASTTSYTAVATYSGDDNYTKSGSQPTGVLVNKGPTTTNFSVTPSSVTYGGESAAIFNAVPNPEFGGTPSGTITVAAGSTPLCTITLPASMCSTGQTSLGAGGYTVTATYHGDQNFESSPGTSALTVNQATPTSPSIANLPSGAAEEGSFVAAVATSGDGGRSVASQTTSTCTVGSDGVTVSFLVAGACTLTPSVSNGHNFTGANGSPQTFTIAFGPRGYWLVGSDGGIFSFGNAQFYGSMGGTTLQRPVVGITPTHTKHGYWLVASDGGIFSFGDSNFFGSIPGLGLHPAGSGQPNSLAAPIVGMVPSSTGNGYFMVASDGGVFAFGDARFAGSCPGIGGCAGAAVAVMPDHSGNGYWLVTSLGAIYAFGDAPFFGAPSPQSSPVVNAVATPDGRGYWILYANGMVLNFGDAAGFGNPVGFVNQFNPATSIFPTTDGLGYWVASARGDVFTFGNAPFLGSMSATPLNGPIIAAFGF